MTTKEKFDVLLKYYSNTYVIKLAEANNIFHSIFIKASKSKYLKLLEISEKLRISEDWECNRTLTNGKILMVELIYKQFKKDGLI